MQSFIQPWLLRATLSRTEKLRDGQHRFTDLYQNGDRPSACLFVRNQQLVASTTNSYRIMKRLRPCSGRNRRSRNSTRLRLYEKNNEGLDLRLGY